MKLLITVLFALFPYLHQQRYEIKLKSCEKEHIVVQEKDEPFEITLFNLKMDDAGWTKACSLLEDAEKIEMEGGIGTIQIKAAGVETDYSYDIDCGVGSVTIGNHSYTGLSAGGEIKNQGSKEMEIDCGVGNVEVSFEGQ